MILNSITTNLLLHTIHNLFERQVETAPIAEALRWRGGQLSYGELNERANRLAHLLTHLGLQQGDRVGIALPRTPELIAALLAVLKVGACYVPLDPVYPPERLAFMVSDAQCQVILTTSALASRLPTSGTLLLCLDQQQERLARQPTHNPSIAVSLHDLAYVIYTSGSTGRPKGVAIEHRSAASFLNWVCEHFSEVELGGMLAATSICFDLSIFEIFGSLCWGGRVLLSENALELPELPDHEQVRLVNTVPSVMREILRLGDLPPNVQTVCLAGEAFPLALARELGQQPGLKRILNLYGPTEDTTYSTWAEVDPSAEQAPSIGRPLPGTQVYVLDEGMNLCPVGVAGELYLGGAGLARGYLGRPDQTAERFVPKQFGDVPGTRLYRTGDRVRMRDNGEMEYLGRLDEQVKIRGYRIELAEVERVLAENAGVKECVVQVCRPTRGDEHLVAYYTGIAEEQQLRSQMEKKLPSYMMPRVFVRLAEMPRTPNGKRDRQRLPAIVLEGVAAAAAASSGNGGTALEQRIAELWQEMLGIQFVERDADFLSLGGHSLLATRIVARIRQETGRNLLLSEFFHHPTIRSLSEFVASLPTQHHGSELSRDASWSHAPLSAGQKQMWFLAQLDPEDTSYNVPCVIRIAGQIEVALVERALNEVVQQHAALRTKIYTNEGQPLQIIEPTLTLPLAVEDLSQTAKNDPWAELCQRAFEMSAQALDLSRVPLFRTKLFQLGVDDWALVFVVHHIVFDDWSLRILVEALSSAYQALERGDWVAATLPVQYADFCAWQHRNDWSEGLAYWRKELTGVPSVLELSRNGIRPAQRSGEGAGTSFLLDENLTQAIEALATREQATVFMVMLAAFQVFLAVLSNQQDFVTVTAVAGRNHYETEDVIGCFINMVPIRATLRGDESFLSLVRRVKASVLAALNHQQVPFERIVEELRLPRDLRYTPLAQVAFGMQNAPDAHAELGGRSYVGTELRPNLARLDLTVWVDQRTGPLRVVWTYCTDLFMSADIARFHEQYTQLLRQIGTLPDVSVASLQSTFTRQSTTESAPRKSFPSRIAPRMFGSRELAKVDPGWLNLPLPTLISAQVPGLDLADWASNHHNLIEEHLHRSGGILFRGFRVESITHFREFACAIASELIQYSERSSPRTQIADGVYTSTDHPPDQPIVLHNEQSYTLNWPMQILFFCARPARKYGRTPIADSRKILRRLSDRTVANFERRGVLYVRNYLPGISLPWTEVFQTQDREVVEDYCRAASLDFEWVGGERLRTRQIRPAVRSHPVTGERTWFNHALFFHVTSLPPNVTQSLRAAVAEQDLPYNTYYGDGEPIEDATLCELREANDAETVSFDWEKGDVLLLDNMLVAHGRQPFEGPRDVQAAMVNPYASLYGKPESLPALMREV